MKLRKQSILTVVLLGCISAASAEPLPTAPITFDPQGTGGVNGIEVGGFDWATNSMLAKEGIPLADGDTFQSYSHTALQSTTDADGNPQGIPGLNSDFEITLVGGVKVVASVAGSSVQTSGPAVDGENFVRIYHDDNVNSDALSGAGYTDGDVILEGAIATTSSSNELSSDPLKLLDSFGPDNWGGTTTVTADGGLTAVILVTDVDPAYFPDLEVGSLLPYSTETVLNFLETNPSRNLDTAGGTTASNVGNINGISGPDFLEQTDPNNSFVPLVPEQACRVTGGGNDTSGIPVDDTAAGWDGSEASSETFLVRRNGRLVEDNRYTFGGQAGANTALQPQPKGELSHTNHSGSAGQWTFHAGTASAPPGTEVDEIICSDEGWCRQARPAPDKQIDFTGIGSFRNIKKLGNLADVACPSDPSDGTAPGKSAAPPRTYHWFEVHIEDLGEPGREGQHTEAPSDICPAEGSGTDAFDNVFGPPVFADANCDCPDFYRLRIYCGVVPDDADNDGKADLDADGNVTNFAAIQAEKFNQPIYEVYGYINGGNWQIHPLTGFDLKNF